MSHEPHGAREPHPPPTPHTPLTHQAYTSVVGSVDIRHFGEVLTPKPRQKGRMGARRALQVLAGPGYQRILEVAQMLWTVLVVVLILVVAAAVLGRL